MQELWKYRAYVTQKAQLQRTLKGPGKNWPDPAKQQLQQEIMMLTDAIYKLETEPTPIEQAIDKSKK